MNDTPLEIERKYLILAPERAMLDALASRRDYIRQTYLTPAEPGTTERVRLRGCGAGAEYTHTVKRRLTDCSREEREEEISPREYRALLERADPALRTLEKTRWCIPWAGVTLEVDLFPFWADRAFLEIELADPDKVPPLPDWVKLVREVTEDRRYTNRALAETVPLEPLPGLGAESLVETDPTRRTWAEIRLDRIEANFQALEAPLPDGCRCLGVVKADAYGHGDVEVARRLEALGCAYLAVACIDEGRKLRQAGILAPILLLGPTPAAYAQALAELDLTQALGSLE
jgi:CYTH domain-containing protein